LFQILENTGVWLKDWAENEGIVQALIDAGVVIITGKVCAIGYSIAQHAILTQAATEEMGRQGYVS
jgi:hypothetical protein